MGKRRGEIKELGPGGVQEYLKEQVLLWGGMYDHFTSPGKRGVPDLIVTWPAWGWARVHFVETKTIGGHVEGPQQRDHKERKAFGCFVKVIWTKGMVDEYVRQHGTVPLTVV